NTNSATANGLGIFHQVDGVDETIFHLHTTGNTKYSPPSTLLFTSNVSGEESDLHSFRRTEMTFTEDSIDLPTTVNAETVTLTGPITRTDGRRASGAAGINTKFETFPCTVEGCPRSLPNKGFTRKDNRKVHLKNVHNLASIDPRRNKKGQSSKIEPALSQHNGGLERYCLGTSQAVEPHM